MSGFTIPNTPDAYNQNQAEPDSLDFQILGNQDNGVVNGMAVAVVSGATVSVSSGEVLINGAYYPFAGINPLSLTTYATSNFFDLVVARVSSGVVSCVVLTGNGGTNPRFPNTVNHDTDVVLAAIWRDGISVTSNSIIDKRVFVRSTIARVASDTVSSNRGATGDMYVNTSWTPSETSTASPLSVKVGSTWYNLSYWAPNTSISTTGSITATTFVGNLTGNVIGNLTGNVNGTLDGYDTATAETGNTIAVRGNDGGITATYIDANNPSYVSSFGSISAGNIGCSNINTGQSNANQFYALWGGSAGIPDYSWGGKENYGMWLGSTLYSGYYGIGFAINGALKFLITTSSAGYVSSRRYKEDIQDATINTSELLDIRLVDYQPIGSTGRATGVIAEELAEIDSCRQFVIFDDNGVAEAVAYDRLAVAYIELLKDHEARLQALENVAG